MLLRCLTTSRMTQNRLSSAGSLPQAASTPMESPNAASLAAERALLQESLAGAEARVRQVQRLLDAGAATRGELLAATDLRDVRLRELYQSTASLLRQLGLRGIHMQRRDGTLGMPEAAPFDRIIVTAGGPEVPRPLVDQLDEGGIMR
mgnify:CR=1 FL=1